MEGIRQTKTWNATTIAENCTYLLIFILLIHFSLDKGWMASIMQGGRGQGRDQVGPKPRNRANCSKIGQKAVQLGIS